MIAVERDDNLYSVEHTFIQLPEPETLRLLLDEARGTFSLLYDEQPDEHAVTCSFFDRDITAENAADAQTARVGS